MSEQNHLDYKDAINQGSYYTPKNIIDIAYNMILANILGFEKYIILDTSCGYGAFLRFPNSIGADSDGEAIKIASSYNNSKFFCHNSLKSVSRAQYNLKPENQIIIIGNPPYNDTTSIIRNGIKQKNYEIDKDLSHRDLGISFLLSYDKLEADYICVLHPLSYLIKKANFESLKAFKKNYKLIDSLIISSREFSKTSKVTSFPIIIALYKRGAGMIYEDILSYNFATKEGTRFCISEFDKLSAYITKYPNKREKNYVANFYTMRDINALGRSRTFIETESYNSIRVPHNKLALYCYADVFKEYVRHIPYYFGNSDIMIDYNEFIRLKDNFMQKSLSKYPFLEYLAPNKEIDNYSIQNYFENLLGEHYVYK